MNDYPLESNTTCSEYSTLEESIWHKISFEIVQKIKGPFSVWPLGGIFLDFQLGLIEFRFSLLVMHFFLAKSAVRTLSQLILTLISLESLCKNKPLNIRMTAKSKRR